MGTFSVKMSLFPWQSRNGKKPVKVNALVDTGSFWSWAPASILHKLGVKPMETVEGELANGTVVTKKVGQIEVEVQGKRRITQIIFGDEGTEPLLGALTLEELGFEVSPAGKQLKPIKIFPMK